MDDEEGDPGGVPAVGLLLHTLGGTGAGPGSDGKAWSPWARGKQTPLPAGNKLTIAWRTTRESCKTALGATVG